MRKVNILFGVVFGLGLAAWMLFSDLGGYTSRSAMIVARSTSVVSTIDGQVVDISATVGAKVAPGSLLVTIENDRIDRGRLTELRSQREFLKREMVTAEAQAVELDRMMRRFSGKASAYFDWKIEDLRIQRVQTYHNLKAAEEVHDAKATEVEQVAQLLKKSHASVATLEKARSDAAIERNQALALQAELARVDLRIASANSAGILQESGNTSYWDEVKNTLEMRLFDNRQKISTMAANLAQTEAQILVETERVGKAFAEQHRAQFDGVINAVLTSAGERVIAGANLLEILDCANPIAIVSVPDHRFGDFYIGQKATIKPLDSEESIAGAVQHISSGALISRDTSIAASPELQVDGNKVIVAFRNQGRALAAENTCETARRAVVTIDTDTFLSKVGSLISKLRGRISSEGELMRTAAMGQDI